MCMNAKYILNIYSDCKKVLYICFVNTLARGIFTQSAPNLLYRLKGL